jgi:hypothetical protein
MLIRFSMTEIIDGETISRRKRQKLARAHDSHPDGCRGGRQHPGKPSRRDWHEISDAAGALPLTSTQSALSARRRMAHLRQAAS